jgi:catechol 2,3-dioxygenase-like lactoylglutathione lyase family enzyme
MYGKGRVEEPFVVFDLRKKYTHERGTRMKIWKIAIMVEDLKAAEDFYAGVLGMEVISSGPGFLYLDAGAVRLELINKETFMFKDDERLGKLGVHHLSFKVDNIKEETEKIKAKGATFLKEPFFRVPGLQLAFFDGLNNVNLQFYDDKRK